MHTTHWKDLATCSLFSNVKKHQTFDSHVFFEVSVLHIENESPSVSFARLYQRKQNEGSELDLFHHRCTEAFVEIHKFYGMIIQICDIFVMFSSSAFI